MTLAAVSVLVLLAVALCPDPSIGDDGLPPISRSEFEECHAQEIAELARDAAALKVYAGLLLLVGSLAALRYVWDVDLEPEDEGKLLPGHRPRPRR